VNKFKLDTVQDKLVKDYSSMEKTSRDSMKDIDSRLFSMVFAYSQSMDYASLQMLESVLRRATDHIVQAKTSIAVAFVQKDIEMNPQDKSVQMKQAMIKQVNQKPFDHKSRSN
jgi:hypothetical protein